jgi:spore germination cell wall hydrolase CwlJ-like protein
MLNPIRSAITVLAALTASSVAPAQVTEGSEPLIASDSGILPVPAVIKLIDNEVVLATGETADPLAPADDGEQADDGAMAEAVDPTADLATLVAQFRASDPGSGELECLAAGVYFESKSEPLAGQLAVGQVIANRANSGRRFPSSYCGVLFQRGQFSFVHGRSYPSVARSSRQWQTAVAIARIVDQELKDSAVPNALFFHAKRVQPRWRLTRVGSVGNHVFYR